MKFRRAVVLPATLSFLFAVSLWIPWEGAWVDRAASLFLSRALGVSVRCQNVKVRAWSRLSFDSAETASSGGDPAIRSGPGAIRFNGWGLLKGSLLPATVELNRVSLPENLHRRVPFLSLQAPDGGQEPIVIDRLRVYILQKKKWIVARLLELTSKEMEARGGVRYDPYQKVDKAHVVLFFSKTVVEKLPESVQLRIIPSQEGRGRIRFVFSGQTLTVIGMHGPLLKAQWG